jgi:hypothetical protein
MDTQDRGPAWWQLSLLMPVMIVLLVLGARAPLSEAGHQTAAIGTALLLYALLGLWVRANRLPLKRANELVALLREPREKVGREEACRESPPANTLQTMPLETRIGKNENEDHSPSQAIELVSGPAKTREG